jgi:hypothetical protein
MGADVLLWRTLNGVTSALANRPAQLLARFYANNRRDGARLLSSMLVIAGAGLVRIDHPIGRVVFVIAALLSVYWWQCYRQLKA